MFALFCFLLKQDKPEIKDTQRLIARACEPLKGHGVVKRSSSSSSQNTESNHRRRRRQKFTDEHLTRQKRQRGSRCCETTSSRASVLQFHFLPGQQVRATQTCGAGRALRRVLASEHLVQKPTTTMQLFLFFCCFLQATAPSIKKKKKNTKVPQNTRFPSINISYC